MSVGLVAAAFVVVAPVPGHQATASCAGPQLAVDGAFERGTPVVERGTQVQVTGRLFVDGCNDTGGSSSVLGCTTHEHEDPVIPLTDIALSIRQHGRTWPLGTADAHGGLGRVAWTVQLPDGLRPGRATLLAGSWSTRVTVAAP